MKNQLTKEEVENLNEQEKLDLFEVQELESRLEMTAALGNNTWCDEGCGSTEK